MAKYGSGQRVSTDHMRNAIMYRAKQVYSLESANECAAQLLNHILNGTMDVDFVRKYLNEAL